CSYASTATTRPGPGSAARWWARRSRWRWPPRRASYRTVAGTGCGCPPPSSRVMPSTPNPRCSTSPACRGLSPKARVVGC
ncbi:MAG: hypothetical protein AVDCRST_MAG03-2994, partial [uncultured Rubrobacteraceae bacterium]